MTTLDSLDDQWAVLLTTSPRRHARRHRSASPSTRAAATSAARATPGRSSGCATTRTSRSPPCTPPGRSARPGPAVPRWRAASRAGGASRGGAAAPQHPVLQGVPRAAGATGCCGVRRAPLRAERRPVALAPVHGGAVGDCSGSIGHADAHAQAADGRATRSRGRARASCRQLGSSRTQGGQEHADDRLAAPATTAPCTRHRGRLERAVSEPRRRAAALAGGEARRRGRRSPSAPAGCSSRTRSG